MYNINTFTKSYMKTTVTITMDKDVKEGLQAFAKKAGTSFSSLLNMAAKDMVHNQKVEFDYSDYFLSPEEEEAKKQAMIDFKNGDYYTLEELEAELNKSDV